MISGGNLALHMRNSSGDQVGLIQITATSGSSASFNYVHGPNSGAPVEGRANNLYNSTFAGCDGENQNGYVEKQNWTCWLQEHGSQIQTFTNWEVKALEGSLLALCQALYSDGVNVSENFVCSPATRDCVPVLNSGQRVVYAELVHPAALPLEPSEWKIYDVIDDLGLPEFGDDIQIKIVEGPKLYPLAFKDGVPGGFPEVEEIVFWAGGEDADAAYPGIIQAYTLVGNECATLIGGTTVAPGSNSSINCSGFPIVEIGWDFDGSPFCRARYGLKLIPGDEVDWLSLIGGCSVEVPPIEPVVPDEPTEPYGPDEVIESPLITPEDPDPVDPGEEPLEPEPVEPEEPPEVPTPITEPSDDEDCLCHDELVYIGNVIQSMLQWVGGVLSAACSGLQYGLGGIWEKVNWHGQNQNYILGRSDERRREEVIYLVNGFREVMQGFYDQKERHHLEVIEKLNGIKEEITIAGELIAGRDAVQVDVENPRNIDIF